MTTAAFAALALLAVVMAHRATGGERRRMGPTGDTTALRSPRHEPVGTPASLRGMRRAGAHGPVRFRGSAPTTRRRTGPGPAWANAPTSAYNLLRLYAESMRSRVTVTVDEAVVRTAEADVAAGRAASVSAWVASAMTERAHRETLQDVLADIRAELGPATDEETAWARSVLGL